MLAGTDCATYSASGRKIRTVTATFELATPNSPALVWIICHWKLFVPGVSGGVTAKLNTASCPGRIVAARLTRLIPQIVLSLGFTDASA